MSVPITREFGYSFATSIAQSPEPVPTSTAIIVPRSSTGRTDRIRNCQRLVQSRSCPGRHVCNTECPEDAFVLPRHLEARKEHRHMHGNYRSQWMEGDDSHRRPSSLHDVNHPMRPDSA